MNRGILVPFGAPDTLHEIASSPAPMNRVLMGCQGKMAPVVAAGPYAQGKPSPCSWRDLALTVVAGLQPHKQGPAVTAQVTVTAAGPPLAFQLEEHSGYRGYRGPSWLGKLTQATSVGAHVAGSPLVSRLGKP